MASGKATHAATTTAATTAHAATHAAAAADFNTGNGEHAALATLAALAATTATTLTTALATLGHGRGDAGHALQTFHEGVGVDAPPAGVQLGGLGQTLTEHDAPLLDGVLEGLLGNAGDDLKNVRQSEVPQRGVDPHRNVVQIDRFGRRLRGLLRLARDRIYPAHSGR